MNKCLLVYQEMHQKQHKINIKITPTCFGVLTPSLGSSQVLSAKLIKYNIAVCLELRHHFCVCNNKVKTIQVKTQLVYQLGVATVLMKQRVSTYSEAMIRFTNVSYRRLITMCDMWWKLRSHHLGLTNHIGENLHMGRYRKCGELNHLSR